VAISPDGKYIVSGSFDNTIKIGELLTGKMEDKTQKAQTPS